MNDQNDIQPPRLAQRFLSWYCRPELLEDLQGDLLEYFNRNLKSKGLKKAQLIYIMDVLKFLRLYTLRKPKLFNRDEPGILLRNYTVIAYRNIRKNKLHSAIKVAGLTLGISCFILIALYVQSEYYFDRHFDKAERIYRVSLSMYSKETNEITNLGWSEAPLIEQLTESFPELEAVTGILKMRGKVKVLCGSNTFLEDNLFIADQKYFSVFSHHWIEGNPQTALEQQYAVVLTEKLSHKYFKNESPLNKTLIINNENYVVTGLIKDLPHNTDIKFDGLISVNSHFPDWCFTYLLFKKEKDAAGFQQKLDTLFDNYLRPILAQSDSDGAYVYEALTDIHFGERRLFDPPKGSKPALYSFAAIGFLILIISGFNYINISIAQSTKRQSEIGIRKVMGAMKNQIRWQYIVESLLICFIALIIAIGLVMYSVPILNSYDILNFDWNDWQGLVLIIFIVLLTVSVAIGSGSYSTLYLASSNTIENLKGKAGNRGQTAFKNSLIVFQFTASLSLIFATQVVYDQMQLLLKSNPGFNKDQVLVVDIPSDETIYSKLPALKNALNEFSFVKNSSLVGSNSIPTSDLEMDTYSVAGQSQIKLLNYVRTDDGYFDVLGLTMVAGRTFNKTDLDSSRSVVIVNEALVKSMGWENPLEQTITYGEPAEVIGVVRNFYFHGMQSKIEPIQFYPNNNVYEKLLVKIESPDMNKILALEKVWKAQLNQPFEYKFLDEYFKEQLMKENILQKLLIYFSALSVVITCLGLFGLISLTIAQKSKETGIRKILGANLVDLLILTWKGYLKLIAISLLISFPIVLFLMARWLENFPNKTAMDLSQYLFGVSILSIVILIIILYQANKIIKMQIIESIKQE